MRRDGDSLPNRLFDPGAAALSQRQVVAATLTTPLVLAAGDRCALVGAYTGSDFTSVEAFARWLGCPPPFSIHMNGWQELGMRKEVANR